MQGPLIIVSIDPNCNLLQNKTHSYASQLIVDLNSISRRKTILIYVLWLFLPRAFQYNFEQVHFKRGCESFSLKFFLSSKGTYNVYLGVSAISDIVKLFVLQSSNNNLSRLMGKPTIWFPTRSDTNWSVQS